MNSSKQVVCTERLRRLPAQFSWVDQRLVRDRHLDQVDTDAAALYLFLITVADARGLSWYGAVSYTHLDVYKRQLCAGASHHAIGVATLCQAPGSFVPLPC